MREIKFRAWEKDKMVYEDDLFYIEYGAVMNQDNNWILMQYTGLKDKNGREIYEGDVVKEEFYGYILEVKLPEFLVSNFDDGCFREDGSVVILGNIYENPELLSEVHHG